MSADSLPEFHKDVAEKHIAEFNCYPCKNPKCKLYAHNNDYCEACMYMKDTSLEKIAEMVVELEAESDKFLSTLDDTIKAGDTVKAEKHSCETCDWQKCALKETHQEVALCSKFKPQEGADNE